MTGSVDLPPQLARFTPDVHEAYRRYRATGDEDAVHTIVTGALHDLLPTHMGSLRGRPLPDAARLIEDLDYDSLAIAELVFFFEDLFAVTISTEDIRSVRTVAELHAFVSSKLREHRQSA